MLFCDWHDEAISILISRMKLGTFRNLNVMVVMVIMQCYSVMVLMSSQEIK